MKNVVAAGLLCILFITTQTKSGLVAQDFNIVVDYKYDTNSFFDTSAKKAALEAAADRFSRIINSNLTAVTPAGTVTTTAGWRIGFTHPGTGASFQSSTASSFAGDPLMGSGAADEYGFTGLAADEWILYAGGRPLAGPAGFGGTGTGINFTSTFDDLIGPMHRGLFYNGSPTSNDLPAWGGSITFDNDGSTSWHFDPTMASPTGTVDLYTIALHEIGHALGLNLSFNQWTDKQSGSTFEGSESLAAYNADNGTSLTALSLVSASNRHWAEDVYDSEIFMPGLPNYTGTVGAGVLQDLLMEPSADFTGTIRRLELTNVDVAALRDLGWSTLAIPEPNTTFAVFAVGLFFLNRRRRI